MYSNYFGLSEPPFAIAPDPRFLYMSEQHREALAHLLYGMNSNGGFILLTGEVGTGKTTVSRCLLEQLPDNTDVAFILNPKYSVTELLAAICDELGILYSKDRSKLKDYVDAINHHLLENHKNGKHTVLIIDEAQNLSVDVLETIRLLTNLETNTEKLLQIILIGQPELAEKLKCPDLRQLNQRITARYHLRALTQQELSSYISHRLSVAGVDCQLFPESSLKRLYKLTQGIPRLVNIICDRALLGAYVQRENKVEVRILAKAADEVLGESESLAGSRTTLSRKALAMAAVVLVATALSAVFFTLGGDLAQWAYTEREPDSLWRVNANEGDRKIIDGVIDADFTSSGRELSNPANWQWPTGTNTALSEVQAYKRLMVAWGLEYDPRKQPAVCRFAESQGLRCLFKIDSLDELVSLNRPAVVKLFNAKGQNFFATILSVDHDVAVIELAGQQRYVKLDELKLWLVGNYTVLWRKPLNYKSAIQPGIEGPEVIWLDRQLAQNQGRAPRYFRLQTYDSGLVRQVKRFQSSHGLVPDGIVGPHTTIHLNSVSSNEAPVLTEKSGGA